MFEFLKPKKDKKDKTIIEKVDVLNKPLGVMDLQSSLDKNIEKLKELFADVDTMKFRYIDNQFDKSLRYCIAYTDGLVNSFMINESIIKPLIHSSDVAPKENLIDTLMNRVLQINEMKKATQWKEIVENVFYGDTILLVDGSAEAIILNTKEFLGRPITEPENEKNLSGPKEGFSESLLTNLSLIRRKVRTNDLKMKYHTMGKRTETEVCICYMDGIVDKRLLSELYKRLEKIDMDAVLDINYITEFVKDNRYSPFRTTGYTERPDVVIGKLLEGRIAVFVDGSPDVLTVPYLFIENFQNGEDYYLSFFYTSFTRLLRILGFFLTLIVPGFYIAIVAFQQEMMPTPLLISISAERQGVPLPAALECFIMIVVFDILRETGIRMPTNIGQALSIVGALVIGQSAVDAKLVAAPMIIVVALTGITSLLVPKMNAPVIYVRLGLLAISAIFGLYGLVLGLSLLIIHLLNLKSLGISQIRLSGGYRSQENKDIVIRAPWWNMRLRTRRMSKDRVRMNEISNENS